MVGDLGGCRSCHRRHGGLVRCRPSGRQTGWQSTGLYAPPGEPVTINLPDGVPPKGWAVRIGAQTDTLWKLEQWSRFPEISQRFALSASKTGVASPFGGLIYLVAPNQGPDAVVEVKLDGVVESPQYILGVTDAKTWQEDIRNRPGPWAELITDKVILTVPSKVVRSLDDPEPRMRFWDRVLDADADLAGRPHQRVNPERLAADTHISAGYMHSGYPVMTHMDAATRMVDLKLLGTKGDWGMFHELGHNHQSGDWTFTGTTEVTCNLFTVYVMETVCTDAGRRKGITPAENLAKLKAHMAKGSDFTAWRNDPFLALSMYMQLRDAFGWDVYMKVLGEYRDLPANQHPKTDQDKREQWMVRMSRACGRDLGPFFAAWGVPATEKARASVKDLPAWLPEGMTQSATSQAAH